MYSIMATFKNATDLKRCIKSLRTHPKTKGRMLVLPPKYAVNPEKQISSVLIKKSVEIASSGLEDIRFGVFTGFIIGALSAFAAVYFHMILHHLSTLSLIGGMAIIFYGGAAGALMGFLIHTLLTKYLWHKNQEEAVLFLQKLDDETKEIVIQNLERHRADKVDIY